MALLYVHQEATLGGIEGMGYVFARRTHRGEEYQGVFFGEDADKETLEQLLEQDEVRFEGVLYRKNRSGNVSEKEKTFLVDAHNLAHVHLGDRVDFKVIDEA